MRKKEKEKNKIFTDLQSKKSKSPSTDAPTAAAAIGSPARPERVEARSASSPAERGLAASSSSTASSSSSAAAHLVRRGSRGREGTEQRENRSDANREKMNFFVMSRWLFVFFSLSFFFRREKIRKRAEEQRRKNPLFRAFHRSFCFAVSWRVLCRGAAPARDKARKQEIERGKRRQRNKAFCFRRRRRKIDDDDDDDGRQRRKEQRVFFL